MKFDFLDFVITVMVILSYIIIFVLSKLFLRSKKIPVQLSLVPVIIVVTFYVMRYIFKL